jgi:hypothetical protein
MSKFTKEEKKELLDEVFFNSEKNIRSTRVTMCQEDEHDWRRVNDIEIACRRCPSMRIVNDSKDYV